MDLFFAYMFLNIFMFRKYLHEITAVINVIYVIPFPYTCP